jgi:anti-anti-sigma factor
MSDKVAISRKQISGEVSLVSNKITDNCIYTGLFGSLDSARMASITENIAVLCESSDIETLIVDLNNVDAIDSAVAAHLFRTSEVMKLLGVKVIFCGINKLVARIMVATNVSIGDVITVRNLKSALLLSYELSGYEVVKKRFGKKNSKS